MFEVFKNPGNFLAGPESNVNKTEKMHFVVVGAGIAGLTNAKMLLAVGHKVRYCIFGSDRSSRSHYLLASDENLSRALNLHLLAFGLSLSQVWATHSRHPTYKFQP